MARCDSTEPVSGDHALEPGEQWREPGLQRRGDEHRSGRRILGVVGDRSARDATARAGTSADLVRHSHAHDLAEVGELERGRKWRAELVTVRGDERGNDDGALRRDGFDVLDGHVTDQLGLGELVGGGEPFAEFPRGAAGELLHPAHAESERLAQDAVVVGVVLVAAEWKRRTRLGEHGRRCHTRRREREHDRAAREDLGVAQAVLTCADQHAQRHRRAGHPVVAGLGEHPHHDLVGVQRTQDHAAPMQQRGELEARELVERRDRFEIGVDAVEQVLGQAGQCRRGADRRARLLAAGAPRAPD